jgi:SpoVK/Ycf46/Vps4 family AAA+-type ATPase
LILFIDEFDALCRMTGDDTSATAADLNTSNSVFLNFFGESPTADHKRFLELTFLFAATNHLKDLPANTLSRFAHCLEIKLPTTEQLFAVLDSKVSKLSIPKKKMEKLRSQLRVFVGDSVGYDFRRIIDLFSRAGLCGVLRYTKALQARKSTESHLTMSDFHKALRQDVR